MDLRFLLGFMVMVAHSEYAKSIKLSDLMCNLTSGMGLNLSCFIKN